MTRVKRLAYGLFEVHSIARWRDYLHLMYGLSLQPSQAAGTFEAQVDDSGCRLMFREGPADDCVAAGWECDDLDGLKAQIEQSGFDAGWGSEQDAADRGAHRLLRARDPNGLIHEVVDRTQANGPFSAADHGAVYDAGHLGFGHMTLMCDDLEAFEAFCTKALGLRPTDYNQPAVGPGIKVYVAFFRANARHHSMAAAELPGAGKKMNHFQLEVATRNDVGKAYDRMRNSRYRMAHHIGVHPNDNQISFYVVTPSGFQSEVGSESMLVEDSHEAVMFTDFSIWGHSMPLREKLSTLRQAWPLLLKRVLGKPKPAPKFFAGTPPGEVKW